MPHPEPDQLCTCHHEAKHHEKINQYKTGRCWVCYDNYQCWEFRLHPNIRDGRETKEVLYTREECDSAF
jgi:hypothetical protein